VHAYPPVKGVAKNLFFVNHDFDEDPVSELNSHCNQFEALFAVRLAQHLLFQGYRPDQVCLASL
jgi:hypothetical protein